MLPGGRDQGFSLVFQAYSSRLCSWIPACASASHFLLASFCQGGFSWRLASGQEGGWLEIFQLELETVSVFTGERKKPLWVTASAARTLINTPSWLLWMCGHSGLSTVLKSYMFSQKEKRGLLSAAWNGTGWLLYSISSLASKGVCCSALGCVQ